MTRKHWRRPLAGTLIVGAILIAAVLLYSLITGVEVIDVDVSLGTLHTIAQRVTGQQLNHLLATYGYWTVLGLVAVESMGIPVPGETMLLVASVYAGTTHRLALPGVILAAACGAILGDNAGFIAGREGGYRVLRRFGPVVGLTERKLKVGEYLFWRHGGKVVFFGRFIAVLRMWAAFLAGAHHMAWRRFLPWNAAGGLAWATVYGVGGYLFGASMHSFSGPVGAVTVVLALAVTGALIVFLRRNERRLEEVAARALPDAPAEQQLSEQALAPRSPGASDAGDRLEAGGHRGSTVVCPPIPPHMRANEQATVAPRMLSGETQ